MNTPPAAKTVFLRDVAADPLLRFRMEPEAETNSRVAEYAEAMAEYEGWGEFPPLEAVQLTEQEVHEITTGDSRRKVKYPAGTLILVGGFTRTAAALKQGIEKAPANVRPGTWSDAQSAAWVENVHGKPRSMFDKMAVIESVRRHHALYSDRPIGPRGIAKLTRIPKSTVERLMKEIDQPEPPAAPCPADSPDPAIAMRSARKVSTTQGYHVEKDLYGTPLPQNGHVQERFAAISKVIAETKKIRESLGRLNDLKDAPGLEGFDDGAVQLANWLVSITDGIPWIVCPNCDGSGDGTGPRGACETCSGNRTLTRVEADDLPPNLYLKSRKYKDGAAAA